MNKIMIAILLTCTFMLSISAQKKVKPWTEWSKKEVQKMLDDSPWSQTQIDTDTSELFYSPTAPGNRGTNASSRTSGGATNQATSVKYSIRFLSAKPVRQAFARVVELTQDKPNAQLSEQLRGFVERSFDQFIAVAVTYESSDQRYSGNALQAFNSANTSQLKNNTYLERKDGKRVFLQQYIAPAKDGIGAKFIFPRIVDDQPFLKADSGEVRFVSEVGKNIKLNMRFKVSDMMYNGQLEY